MGTCIDRYPAYSAFFLFFYFPLLCHSHGAYSLHDLGCIYVYVNINILSYYDIPPSTDRKLKTRDINMNTEFYNPVLTADLNYNVPTTQKKLKLKLASAFKTIQDERERIKIKRVKGNLWIRMKSKPTPRGIFIKGT
jgi:hypothetical protein